MIHHGTSAARDGSRVSGATRTKHSGPAKHVRPLYNLNALIARTCRIFDNTFDRVQKSKTARLLDAEFGNFDMPKIAAWSGPAMPTPSNIVFGSDEAVIRLSDLAKYEEIFARAKRSSRALRALEGRLDVVNKSILKRFTDTRVLHRGMSISEFCTISKMSGAVGFHNRTKYAAVNNFVSCSVSPYAASMFAILRGELVMTMDASRIKESDCAPVTYEAKRHIRVTRGGKRMYNPYEMFGGRKAGMFMRECEVHLRVGSRPVIVYVSVFGAPTPRLCRRLDSAVKTLEAAQQKKIMIKYNEVQQ